MKNALREIVDIERRAREILEAADEEIRAIEVQAKEDVDRIRTEGRQESEQEIRQRRTSSQEAIERYRAEVTERQKTELDRLEARCESSKAEAVNRIIRGITVVRGNTEE